MNKKNLTEADIRTKFITPAIAGEGREKWDVMTDILEEQTFTRRRVIVRGKTVYARPSQKNRLHPVVQTQHPHCPCRSKGQLHRPGNPG